MKTSNVIMEKDQDQNQNEEITCNGKAPFVKGQEFMTLEEPVQMYYKYANSKGFFIRKSSTRMNAKKELSMKRYVCQKEEFYKKKSMGSCLTTPNSQRLEDEINEDEEQGKERENMVVRVGCKAELRMNLNTETGNWKVGEFVEEHNHEMATPTKAHYLPINRKMSKSNKRLFTDLSEANIQPLKQASLYVLRNKDYRNINCTIRDIGQCKRDIKGDNRIFNADVLIKRFEDCQKMNNNFKYELDLDEQGQLKHLFWADQISVLDYKLFGDAVIFDTIFDTIFNTNHYGLIVTIFLGVNHHKSSVLFGSAFLSNENIESFCWLFSAFFKSMSGKAPTGIVTNQNPSLLAAIPMMFPNTKHRLCAWHIRAKLPTEIDVISLKKEAMRAFDELIFCSHSVKEFENKWSAFIAVHKLDNCRWLKDLYVIRDKWAPTFLTNHFFAGMTTLQRSESLKKKNTTHRCLLEFVVSFEAILSTMREKENIKDHVDLWSQPKLKTPLEIVKIMMSYTREIFIEFQVQLWNSLNYIMMQDVEGDEECKIHHIHELGSSKTDALVKVENNNCTPRCTCKHMEVNGVPCKHLLVYYNATGIKRLNDENYWHRWNQMPKKADEDKYARTTLEEKKQLNIKAITDEIVEL